MPETPTERLAKVREELAALKNVKLAANSEAIARLETALALLKDEMEREKLNA